MNHKNNFDLAVTSYTPVPYIDFHRMYADMKTELDIAYHNFMDSGSYILGAKTQEFEKAFAEFSKVKHCIGVSNGLEAITLLLQAWGIGEGDEVICATNSFVATALGITRAGAQPVLVEARADTYNIDALEICKAITPKTKAIALTHLYGQTADMDDIMAVAKQHGLKVLEDAAQAHGALYKGKPAGGLGDGATFSFYPTKNLGAFGDGGAITTNDDQVAAYLRKARNYGSTVKYHHEILGTNSRLDELQAAFLLTKMAKISEWNARRQAIAAQYINGLRSVDGLVMPHVPQGYDPIWHVFVVRVLNGKRAGLIKHLEHHGIGYNIHYPVPIHQQPCYQDLPDAKKSFPIAEQQSLEILSLPCDAYHVDEEISYVIDVIRNYFEE